MPVFLLPLAGIGLFGTGWAVGSWTSNGWVKAAFWLAVLFMTYKLAKGFGVIK
ncbi:MAG: hypothetical protein IE936_09725 [Moraxella osloensis]|nr:hypothetical protein [Moraxella osloensis]